MSDEAAARVPEGAVPAYEGYTGHAPAPARVFPASVYAVGWTPIPLGYGPADTSHATAAASTPTSASTPVLAADATVRSSGIRRALRRRPR